MIPKVSAIIVNYRTADHTLECIAGLLEQVGVDLQIIVVDNYSQDGSIERINQAYKEKITLIAHSQNSGFSKANNIAAKIATGDFIVCVNPDIKLIQTDTLVRLVSYLEMHENVGLVGPQVVEPRKNRNIRPKTQYPEQSQLRSTSVLKDLPGNWAWIIGAFMMLPTTVYRMIGGFDDEFFLYGEDTDICLHVRKAGYEISHLAEIKVIHWSSASEEQSMSYDKWRRKKNGYYQFCAKHYDVEDMQRILQKRIRKLMFDLKIVKIRQWIIGRNYLQDKVDRILAELDVIKMYRNSGQIKN